MENKTKNKKEKTAEKEIYPGTTKEDLENSKAVDENTKESLEEQFKHKNKYDNQ